jgi:hypothetical protein
VWHFELAGLDCGARERGRDGSRCERDAQNVGGVPGQGNQRGERTQSGAAPDEPWRYARYAREPKQARGWIGRRLFRFFARVLDWRKRLDAR